MGALSWILYFLGFACVIMGILTVTTVIPEFAKLTGVYWVGLGGVFFLASIAGFTALSRYE